MSTMKLVREQVQAGIDARLATPPLECDEMKRILAAAGARMLGLDGASVEEAARQAVCAGGPSVEQLEQMIRARRTAAAGHAEVAA
ncbi:hypothetical protein ACXET9_07090 [Brachybacterium sp. DNPG3]